MTYSPGSGTALAIATLALFGGAMAMPGGTAAWRRVRGTVWLASTAAAALFFGILGDGLGWRPVNVTLLIGLGTSAYAVVPWLWSRRMLGPQLALLATTLVAAGAVGAHLNAQYWPGLAVWFTALEWFLLGHGDLVPAGRPTQVAAGAGLIVGAEMMLPLAIGIVLGLATAAGLLVYALASATTPPSESDRGGPRTPVDGTNSPAPRVGGRRESK